MLTDDPDDHEDAAIDDDFSTVVVDDDIHSDHTDFQAQVSLVSTRMDPVNTLREPMDTHHDSHMSSELAVMSTTRTCWQCTNRNISST